MNVLDSLFDVYQQGHAAALVTGRSLYDLVADGNGEIRPLIEVLRRSCRERYGMVLVTYSLAGGLDWGASRITNERDRQRLVELLREHHLTDIQPEQNEVVRVIRGISSLCRAPMEELKWADGRDLRLCFLLEFGEHLMPSCTASGCSQADAQLAAIELAHMTAQSLSLRASGNLILFHARDGMLDELVSHALHHVRLPYPDATEKAAFLATAQRLYTQALFADGITPDVVARSTANTPNRSLESLLRGSHRSRHPITMAELLQQKVRDVEEISEHTLTLLDSARVAKVELCGASIATPSRILTNFAAALRRGDPATPLNLLLVGAPGCGKTDLAILTARHAGVPAYQLLSPKTGIVGETERRARLQQETLGQWTPAIAFSDELNETFPTQRSDFNGDSGASSAVLGCWLTALSDTSRAGKCLIIGTTNCVWRMSEAMRSRFVIIPVLQPVESDYPAIVTTIAMRLAPDGVFDPSDAQIREAARLFNGKGASPRQIHGALGYTRLAVGELTPKTVRLAAEDLRSGADRSSGVYADLWAIKAATSRSFLPWSQDASHYPYPAYLKDLVDHTTGEVDETLLDRRIAQLEPHANV